MDIDLLSKMVYDLILEHDRVALPGVGCFVAEIVPASFSDRGYTINPPYRKLCFRSRPDDGNLLVRLYARSNDVTEDVARRILTDFLSEMKEVLRLKKVVIFPGLGRLRATRENNLFFVADEALDIYPEGFGLQPLSLKTHKETAQGLAETISGIDAVLHPEPASEPASEPVSEPASEPAFEPASEPVSESAPEPAPESAPESPPESAPESARKPTHAGESADTAVSSPVSSPVSSAASSPAQAQAKARRMQAWRTALIVTLSLLLAAAAFFGIFFLLKICSPDFLDTLLYTGEELEIINYKL